MPQQTLSSAVLDNPAHMDWQAIVRELTPVFASRAAAHDAEDSFVAENFRDLAANHLLSAGIPLELGGGGLSHAELCGMLRALGRACGSTALALSMHTHLVAMMVWNYHRGQPVAPTLQRIASNELVLVSTGASDWLTPSAKAVRVDGGYRVSGRKIFSSGSPAGSVLVTMATLDHPVDGATALHFSVPMRDPGVTVLDNWRALGMRGTGSNDVLLDDVFVPDAAVTLRRAAGKWHPVFNAILTIALPLILSPYLGVAEAARDLAVQQVQRKREHPEVWYLIGELENALTTAQTAIQAGIDLCGNYNFTPDDATGNAAAIRKTIAAQALLLAVEKALEVVGGSGVFRSMGLERLLREIHGVQFHPLQAKRQQRMSGRLALGLQPVD
jgi:alkylation response protein AidB-like acyl-CoA dehydrogenase